MWIRERNIENYTHKKKERNIEWVHPPKGVFLAQLKYLTQKKFLDE